MSYPVGIVFCDPAFTVDSVGVVGAKTSIEPASGRVKVEVLAANELPPPQTAGSILDAIVAAEAAVLKETRGAALHIGADISGNGAAMAMPILGRYYGGAQVRFIRWHGGDAHARPTTYEAMGQLDGKMVGAPVWGMSRSTAFAELDEVANAGRLVFAKDIPQEDLDKLAAAIVGTQTKTNASGRIVPATDQSMPDDLLSALVGAVAIANHAIDWNAAKRAMMPRPRPSAPRSAAGWT